jgi:TonB family protein
MNQISLLNWMLLSTVLLGVWWLCYRLALRQERGFVYNRAYLVLGPLLAAVLPLLPLAWPANWVAGPAALPGISTVLLPTVQVGAGTPAVTDWSYWLQAFYLAGVGLLLARLAYGLLRLWRSTRGLPRNAEAGYTLLHTHGQLPTSSFGRVVLWNDTLPLSPAEAWQVLRHELAHVRQGHTYDRLLLEVLQAVLWFNPFVHLCSRALGLTHEFLADEAALKPDAAVAPAVSSPAFYTQLLARQVATRLGFSAPLAHSFSQSQTLRRIAMIQKTTPVRRWKQWLALPALGALLFTVACAQSKEVVAPAGTPIPTVHIQDLTAPPPPPPPIPISASGNRPAPPSPPAVYTYAEQMPELPSGGGNAAIVDNIQRHIVYPTVAPANQQSGKVFVSFIVTDKGEVQGVTIVKGLSPAYDAAVVAAVQQLPRLVPGKQGGKAVNVSFTVPVLFASLTLPSGEQVKIISK